MDWWWSFRPYRYHTLSDNPQSSKQNLEEKWLLKNDNDKNYYEVWDDISYEYPFPDFNGENVEVWEWIIISSYSFMCMWLFIHDWINSLWPSDTIWRHISGSTLAQVMDFCLTAPSHYLDQRWLIISKVQWHSSECNFTRDTSAISHWN